MPMLPIAIAIAVFAALLRTQNDALLVPPAAAGIDWSALSTADDFDFYVPPGGIITTYLKTGTAFRFQSDGKDYAFLRDQLSGTDATGQHTAFRSAFESAAKAGSALRLKVRDGRLLSADPLEPPDYANDYFMVHAGVVNSRPYTFTRDASGAMTLDREADSKPAGYVEAYFRRRAAWLNRQDIDFETEVRLGFTFAGEEDTDATEISKTAVGTGDFYGDVDVSLGNLGWDVALDFGSWGAARGARGRIAPAIHGGWTTDRGFQSLHGYYGVGGAASIAFPTTGVLGDGYSNREVQLGLGIFGGVAEYPDFLDDTGRGVRLEHEHPYFTRKASLLIDVQASIPFGANRYFVISGNFLDRFERPFDLATWSLMIGVTIPIGEVAKSLFGS